MTADSTSVPTGARANRQPLRVLHVVTSDAFAGIERHVIRLSRELRVLGCAAELACPPAAARMRAEAQAAGIPVHPSATRRPRLWLGDVARNVATESPDVVHLHDGRAAVAGALLAPLAGGLMVRTQHFTRPASVERSGLRGRMSRRLHRVLNRKLDGYIAVAQRVLDGALERHETGGAEVVVISPGIELPAESALSQARVLRDGLAHPVIAYIGRLETEKRLEILLDAVPRVRGKIPDCQFVIAGSGGAEKELRSLADRLEIESAVTFKGEVARPDSVLARAHVYVNPWPWEGFGLAMAEAMAFALPVVAVNSGASPELVEDGVTGLLVPAGDAAALANALISLARDRRLGLEMGALARQRATAQYGVERTARDTLAFYRKLWERAAR